MTELVFGSATSNHRAAGRHPFRSHWRLVASSERLRESLNKRGT